MKAIFYTAMIISLWFKLCMKSALFFSAFFAFNGASAQYPVTGTCAADTTYRIYISGPGQNSCNGVRVFELRRNFSARLHVDSLFLDSLGNGTSDVRPTSIVWAKAGGQVVISSIDSIVLSAPQISGLSAVATSGVYSDLSNLPTLYAEPPGTIKMYGGSSAPTGYFICDGAAVSRTTYSALFAITGTAYGVGNGTTTFNLPDLQQRFPLGKATSGTGSTLGGTGGAIDHLHTVDPASTSTSSNGAHTHTATPASLPNISLIGIGTGADDTQITTSSDGAHTHSVDISQFNSGAANPPYVVVNFIIKY